MVCEFGKFTRTKRARMGKISSCGDYRNYLADLV